jgi:hypothetical protein
MKDQLTTVMEAVRRAQAVLAEYIRPGDRDPEVTIAKLVGILDSRDLVRAMRLLYPAVKSPSISSRGRGEDKIANRGTVRLS